MAAETLGMTTGKSPTKRWRGRPCRRCGRWKGNVVPDFPRMGAHTEMGGVAAGRAEQGGVGVSHSFRAAGGARCEVHPGAGPAGEWGAWCPECGADDVWSLRTEDGQAHNSRCPDVALSAVSSSTTRMSAHRFDCTHTSTTPLRSAGLPPSVGRQQQPRYARESRSRERTRRRDPLRPRRCRGLACVPLACVAEVVLAP